VPGVRKSLSYEKDPLEVCTESSLANRKNRRKGGLSSVTVKQKPLVLRVILSDEDLFAVSESIRVIGEREDLASVSKPVKERGGEDGIAEEINPAIKALVGGNDNRGIFIELRDELKEEVGLNLAYGKIAKLINDQKISVFNPLNASLRVSGDFTGFEDMNEVIH